MQRGKARVMVAAAALAEIAVVTVLLVSMTNEQFSEEDSLLESNAPEASAVTPHAKAGCQLP